uniref:Uncharacterized protein n=1 Tax=Panagrolaimus superbus TaxID=310955 RepID=A0A914ZG56_9BILA
MALKAGLSLDKNIQQLYDKIYEEDFEKLCPIYRRALEDLAAKLNALKTAEEKLLILEKFSEIYLLLPKYARQKIELQKVVSRQHPMISTAAAATCVQPLYSVPFSETIKSINPWTIRQLIADLNCTDKHIAWKSFPVNFDKQLKNISNVERSIKDTERALTFPHRYLQKVFDYYKIMGSMFGFLVQFFKSVKLSSPTISSVTLRLSVT